MALMQIHSGIAELDRWKFMLEIVTKGFDGCENCYKDAKITLKMQKLFWKMQFLLKMQKIEF